MKKFLIGSGVVVLLFVAIAASGDSASKAETPAPEAKTITKTVEVERTPKACIDALALADEGFGVVASVFGVMGEDLADGRLSATTETALEDTSDWFQTNVDKYHALKAECRASVQ